MFNSKHRNILKEALKLNPLQSLCLSLLSNLAIVSLIWFYLTLNAGSSDLRKNIENLEKNSVTSLRTLVNLGSEVYMQADV